MGTLPTLFGAEYFAALDALNPRAGPIPARLSHDERVALFVAEYVVDLNGTEAAKRAGYSPHTAAQQASRLLRNVKVVEAVKAAQAEHLKRTALTAQMVLEQLRVALTFDIRTLYDEAGHLLPMSLWPPEAAVVVESIESEDQVTRIGKLSIKTGMAHKVGLWKKSAAHRLAMEHLALLQSPSVRVEGQVEHVHKLDGLPDDQLRDRIRTLRERAGQRLLTGPREDAA